MGMRTYLNRLFYATRLYPLKPFGTLSIHTTSSLTRLTMSTSILLSSTTDDPHTSTPQISLYHNIKVDIALFHSSRSFLSTFVPRPFPTPPHSSSLHASAASMPPYIYTSTMIILTRSSDVPRRKTPLSFVRLCLFLSPPRDL